MRIALVTPAGSGTRTGNRHTALRWATFLRHAGHSVSLMTEWTPHTEADLMLALHARRSHPSIRAFADALPGRPLVVALTGTDVYRDIHVSAEARESLALAHRLVVLQPRAIDELPAFARRKTRVVYQSCATRLRHDPVKRGFRICVIGHLREEKDPLRALAALAQVRRDAGIEVVQLGAALDARFALRARAAMAREPRYRWLGSVPHALALRWLASSHAMVISSRMEGGANVVSEALRIGVPVLASRIPGNLGLLGAAHAGYFPLGEARALAALMLRAASDAAFYGRLKSHSTRLRPMVAPSNEARLLLAALAL
ncbi:MAG TPA: selenoneine biosynthesis selenosugar synthase SenB [Burkholderiales bacterium]|nr:selenoneine biosynthesis selenosugar synthase SenB [Burkholderiales bacterium]